MRTQEAAITRYFETARIDAAETMLRVAAAILRRRRREQTEPQKEDL